MRVIWNYAASPGLIRYFASLEAHDLFVDVCPESDDTRLFRLLADAEVLWHCLRPVDVRVFDAAPRLALVQKIGVGLNTIDLATAQSREVAVCNLPGTNSQAVAEHTLALLFAVLRQIPRFDDDTRHGRGWSWDGARQDALGEVAGRTIGLVGYGAVPERLAPVLGALGAHVVYTATADKGVPGAEYRDLDALLAESDIVSLHVPLTEATHGLIDAVRLRAMKPGSVLINTARGALVDESALIAALDDGHLRGVGLDVFGDEPLPDHHPLLGRDDVVVTPHVAWLTGETLHRSLAVAVENCRRLAAGEALLHRVA